MNPPEGPYEIGRLSLLRLAGTQKVNCQQPIDGCEKHNFGQVIEVGQDRLDQEVNPSHHKLRITDDE